MRKLLLNKRGNGVTDILGNFFSLLPRPLQLVLFLLILLLIGVIIQFLLQVFGVYCNSADQPVNVGIGLDSVTLWLHKPSFEDLNKEGIALNKIIAISTKKETDCSIYITDGYLIDEFGNQEEITEGEWFYDGAFCTDCEVVKIFNASLNFISRGDFDIWNGVCRGNVNFKDDKGWYKHFWCDTMKKEFCQPPRDYYYNSGTNMYVCNAEACSKSTSETIKDNWDNTLNDAGATFIYPEGLSGEIDSYKDYRRAVGVTCKDLAPQIAIFGINVFDYKLWILIFLLSILFWIYWKIKKA